MTNLANVSFNYQETVTGAIAPSVGMRGMLSLEVIRDDTQTLSQEFAVIEDASENEAKAKRMQIHYQAAGQFIQGVGQAASGVVAFGTMMATSYSSDMNKLQGQQTDLENQRGDLENLQKQFNETAKKNTSVPEIDLSGADDDDPVGDIHLLFDEEDKPKVNNSVQTLADQMSRGDFSMSHGDFSGTNADTLQGWKDSGLSKLNEDSYEKPEDYNKALSDELTQEAMNHIAQDPNASDKMQKSLESQITDLNKKVGVVSDQITNKTTKFQTVKSLLSDGASAVSSMGQSITTELSAKWSTSEIFSQNMSTVVQMMMQALEKVLQAAYQGMDSTTNMLVGPATATAA